MSHKPIRYVPVVKPKQKHDKEEPEVDCPDPTRSDKMEGND